METVKEAYLRLSDGRVLQLGNIIDCTLETDINWNTEGVLRFLNWRFLPDVEKEITDSISFDEFVELLEE